MTELNVAVQTDMELTRIPQFMGTWYSDDPDVLSNQLNGFLSKAKVSHEKKGLRAIIVPHAGYQYAGQTAAYSYSMINPSVVKRIFILAPLHHLRAKVCLLPECRFYQTQFNTIEVDIDAMDEIAKLGTFKKITVSHDQDEHSLELQLNYISHVMRKNDYKIVPIYVGQLSGYDQNHYASLLFPYLSNEENLFIISSDFCHYGDSFNYTPFEGREDISDCIFKLDHKACDAILQLSLKRFEQHLNMTKNTICGRYPICLFLNMIHHFNEKHSDHEPHFKSHLLNYIRSKKNVKPTDSSVSYVAISIHLYETTALYNDV